MDELPCGLDPDEIVLRRIANVPGHFDPSLPIPVFAGTFRPSPEDDDGLSFYRERRISPEDLARSARKPAECYVVARFRVRDLTALGLSLVPKQEEGDLPGHLIVPEINHETSKNPTTRSRVKELQAELAKLAGRDIRSGFTSPPPASPAEDA